MPGVHRDTDARECGAKTTVVGQSTVFVNNLLAAVQNDPNTHANGELLADVNPGTVFFGGLLVVLEGSSAQPDRLCPPLGPPHCNPKAAQSSGNVFVGGGGGAGPGGGADAGASDEEGEAAEGPEEETLEPELEPESPTDETLPTTTEERIEALNLSPTEQASVEQAVAEANAETGLDWVPVRDVQTGEVFLATSDYLRNPDGSYIRSGTSGARAIADNITGGAQLPNSRSQVDSIHAAANYTPPFYAAGIPSGSNYNDLVSSSDRYYDAYFASNGISPQGGEIVSGQFKTVMDGGIYHGVFNNGRVVQPYSNPHSGEYVDYSQAIRLIRRF